MKNPSVLVALRTHFWDADIDNMARRLYGLCAGFDFVVTVDETNGPIDVSPFDKISHTQDSSILNLPHYPKNYNNLHYNGDYVFYFLKKERPQYDLYVLIENDTFINFPISDLIHKCLENDIDLCGFVDEINSDSHKIFHKNSLRYYSEFGRVFFPFVILSSKNIDSLYNMRLKMNNEITSGDEWPYCESFIAAHTISNKNMNLLKINDDVNTKYYTFRNYKYINDPSIYTKNSISHPVVGCDFYKKSISSGSILDLFNKKSKLFTGLDTLFREGNLYFFHYIENEVKKLKNDVLISKFYNMSYELGWIQKPILINRAYKCATTQSSVHKSLNQTIFENSSLLVDGVISKETKSQTEYELNPWIEIDLEDKFEILSVSIYVRPYNFHLFNNFYLSFSCDGNIYEIVYRKADGIVPDAADLKPIIIEFSKGFFAKNVRLTLDNTESLALNQVEIYSY